MNLYKAHLVHIFSGTFQPLISDLKASTDSNLFKLFDSSSHILGPKYDEEFSP